MSGRNFVVAFGSYLGSYFGTNSVALDTNSVAGLYLDTNSVAGLYVEVDTSGSSALLKTGSYFLYVLIGTYFEGSYVYAGVSSGDLFWYVVGSYFL